MRAVLACAAKFNEVIMFRSTGPWSRPWIERGWPTKSFHVKGKSADWGPQAGLIPYDGIYSKVGADRVRAEQSTEENAAAVRSRYAGTTHLRLTDEDLQRQRTVLTDVPARSAIEVMQAIPGTADYFLSARRSGDQQLFFFRAVRDQDRYRIMVYPQAAGSHVPSLMAAPDQARPLLVMTTLEAGAEHLPLTGDYDLLSVCPTWRDYKNRSPSDIEAPCLEFPLVERPQESLIFPAGSNLDKLLEMRTNTGVRPSRGRRNATFQGLTKAELHLLQEHHDMGNITPRILRCINALNQAMGAVNEKAVFRRVHHGAESDRNHIHGALTKEEMKQGEGLPITVFQPPSLQRPNSPTHRYGDVSTLTTYDAFKTFVTLLDDAGGYYVAKNWTWGISIRDKHS